jgi:hypothetical protein
MPRKVNNRYPRRPLAGFQRMVVEITRPSVAYRRYSVFSFQDRIHFSRYLCLFRTDN